MPPTPKRESGTSEGQPAEGITYIDMGDYTLEIDNRGPVQQRRNWPKSHRGIAVSSAVRRELEERIETEVEAPAKLAREEAEADAKDRLPPVEDEGAVEKREKEARELLDKANEERNETQEEAQAEVRAKS